MAAFILTKDICVSLALKENLVRIEQAQGFEVKAGSNP